MTPSHTILQTFKAAIFKPPLNNHDHGAAVFCAGYAVRSMLRGGVCQSCRVRFTVPGEILRVEFDKGLAATLDYKYIMDLDRGGLTYPSEVSIMIAESTVAVFEHLTCKYVNIF